MTGKASILTPLIKPFTEAALAAELDARLAQDLEANRKNGSTPKTVKTPTGAFEPQRVKKHQTTLSDEIERKIIRMFALGMSDKAISQEIALLACPVPRSAPSPIM